MSLDTPQVCPHCGSKNITEILYGLPAPTEEEMRKIRAGEIVLGGCIVMPELPAWACLDCNKQFGTLSEES